MFLIDMACPSKNNVDAKHAEKLQKYQKLALKIRERRPGYNVTFLIGIHPMQGRTATKKHGDKRK